MLAYGHGHAQFLGRFFTRESGHHPLGLVIDRLWRYLCFQQSSNLGFDFLRARLTRPIVAPVELAGDLLDKLYDPPLAKIPLFNRNTAIKLAVIGLLVFFNRNIDLGVLRLQIVRSPLFIAFVEVLRL